MPGRGTAHLRGDASSLTLRVIIDEFVRRGLEADLVLRPAGVTKFQLLNPLGRLPRSVIGSVTEHAAELAKDDALHLHATANAEVGAFGVADFIVVMGPTIGAGFARVAKAFGLVNSGLSIDIALRHGTSVLSFHSVFEEFPHRLDVETLMVACGQRFRAASAGACTPIAAERTGLAPGYRGEFERLLGCPITFGHDCDTLTYPLDAWNQQPAHYHPAVTAMLTVFRDAPPQLVGQPVRERAVRIIEQRMGSTQLGAGSVARACGLSERTLHRRLAAEGCSFSDLLDAARYARAEVYLCDPSLSLAAIARLLGFADASAFARAYKRWAGLPPRRPQVTGSP